MHEEALGHRHRDSPIYWRFNAESLFLSHSYLMDDLLREHNERYFYLTAQNLRICNDVWVSCIMFRLGQQEVGSPMHCLWHVLFFSFDSFRIF